jgi:hypothetical protein
MVPQSSWVLTVRPLFPMPSAYLLDPVPDTNTQTDVHSKSSSLVSYYLSLLSTAPFYAICLLLHLLAISKDAPHVRLASQSDCNRNPAEHLGEEQVRHTKDQTQSGHVEMDTSVYGSKIRILKVCENRAAVVLAALFVELQPSACYRLRD